MHDGKTHGRKILDQLPASRSTYPFTESDILGCYKIKLRAHKSSSTSSAQESQPHSQRVSPANII